MDAPQISVALTVVELTYVLHTHTFYRIISAINQHHHCYALKSFTVSSSHIKYQRVFEFFCECSFIQEEDQTKTYTYHDN